jgi:hypothetical protein
MGKGSSVMSTLGIQVKTTGEVVALDGISLDTLQTAVGGWVQAIDLDEALTMWCNEEGKLVGLPHNPFAQFAWDKVYGANTDYLVGDVVFTGGTGDEGETLPLDDDTADQIRVMVQKVREIIEPRAQVIA